MDALELEVWEEAWEEGDGLAERIAAGVKLKGCACRNVDGDHLVAVDKGLLPFLERQGDWMLVDAAVWADWRSGHGFLVSVNVVDSGESLGFVLVGEKAIFGGALSIRREDDNLASGFLAQVLHGLLRFPNWNCNRPSPNRLGAVWLRSQRGSR